MSPDQLRQALEQVETLMSRPYTQNALGERALQSWREVAGAARAYADLLENGALIIEQDGNGWESAVGIASRRAMNEVGLVGFVDAFLRILYDMKTGGESP